MKIEFYWAMPELRRKRFTTIKPASQKGRSLRTISYFYHGYDYWYDFDRMVLKDIIPVKVI